MYRGNSYSEKFCMLPSCWEGKVLERKQRQLLNQWTNCDNLGAGRIVNFECHQDKNYPNDACGKHFKMWLKLIQWNHNGWFVQTCMQGSFLLQTTSENCFQLVLSFNFSLSLECLNVLSRQYNRFQRILWKTLRIKILWGIRVCLGPIQR